ncbi:MAG: restriction endonuclease subunit S [bacterium]|nr:restriction endonuclease subunit S [bacterium]
MPRTSWEKVSEYRPWVPSVAEQRAIADYLDTETNRIDTLITKKRNLIELLDHRLVSFATYLVNGEGKSQASGIPSIPYMPRRWQVLRNKVFMHEVNERSSTGDEELLSVSHLTGVTPRSEKTVYMFKAESMVGYKLVRPGDLAVNTMWAWMGAAGVSRHHGIVSPSYGVYRIDQATVLPKYFDLLVRTPAYICEMTRYSRGVTSSRLRLYPDELLALRTPVPPMAEQRQIAQRFEREADKARMAIDALGRQVELLNERRQALITAAVTGGLAVSEGMA